MSITELSNAETIARSTAIKYLNELVDSLVLQLVDASNEIANTTDIPDPLDHVDEDVLDALLGCGANPDGLRMLLALEDEDCEK